MSQKMVKYEESSWGIASAPRYSHMQPDGEDGSFGEPRSSLLESDRLHRSDFSLRWKLGKIISLSMQEFPEWSVVVVTHSDAQTWGP
jgi:hypothetical protein